MSTYHVLDPIHGFIELSSKEMRIVDSAPFQRLRRIRQLGTTYLLYPSAEHTRFAHSIGVMHVASVIFDTLYRKNAGILRWSDEERSRHRRMLRLAALLHDIGHGPFSHVGDGLFSPDVGNHEKMAERIILDTEIGDIIDEIGNSEFTRTHVAAMITGGLPDPDSRLVRDIFSGEMDADKMDYTGLFPQSSKDL